MISYPHRPRKRNPNSASQADVFQLCERKWAFQYKGGIQPDKDWSAAFGLRGHSLCETYAKTGQLPDPEERLLLKKPSWDKSTYTDVVTRPGLSVMGGIEFIPRPGTYPVLGVEGKFHLVLPRSGVWKGFKDLRISSYYDRLPYVLDHKFSGNIHSKFVKTADKLVTDIPAILYAASEMTEHKAQAVDLEWIYYLRIEEDNPDRSRPQGRRIYLRMLYDQVAQVIPQIDEVGVKMQEAWDKPLAPHEHTANRNACSAFGGCPYKGKQCTLTLAELNDE